MTDTTDAARVAEEMEVRKAFWTTYVSRLNTVGVDKVRATVWESTLDCSCGCQIEIHYDPCRYPLHVRFVREGQEILDLQAHRYTVFRASNNVLYFAHFGEFDSGCSVAAYDLKGGAKLWRTTLLALGPVFNSGAYSNRVSLSLRDKEGVVFVAGEESMGNYAEILDQKTGERLAHKAFPRQVPNVQPAGLFPDDRRLDVKVTYHYPDPTAFPELFRNLSKQTGVPLSVAPEFDQARITAAEHSESLRSAMSRWSEGSHFKWVRDGDGYRLIMTRCAGPPIPDNRSEGGRSP